MEQNNTPMMVSNEFNPPASQETIEMILDLVKQFDALDTATFLSGLKEHSLTNWAKRDENFNKRIIEEVDALLYTPATQDYVENCVEWLSKNVLWQGENVIIDREEYVNGLVYTLMRQNLSPYRIFESLYRAKNLSKWAPSHQEILDMDKKLCRDIQDGVELICADPQTLYRTAYDVVILNPYSPDDAAILSAS